MMKIRLLAFSVLLCAINDLGWALNNSDVDVSLATSPHFILDHNKPCEEGPSASYVGIKVENTSGGTLHGVTVTLKTLTSTAARASTRSDSVLFIGSIDDNASKTAYFYIKFPCSDGVDIDFTFDITDDQSGTVNFSTTVTSENAISASAGGQVDSRTTDTSVILGGLISDTITYSFGNIQVGDEIEFQPSGDSLFDPNQLVLLNCKIISSDIPINVPVGTTDQMYFVATKKYTGTNKKVKVVFFFINKMTSGNATLTPFAALTSGNNLKYSGNFGSGIAYKTITAATNTSPFEVTRSLDNSILSANDTVVFSIEIVNTSTETVMFDEIVETLDTGYTFVGIEPESDVTSALLTAEPTTSSIEEISFVGGVEEATYPYESYTIEPSDTITLVYSATAPSSNTSLDETTTEVMIGGNIGGGDESQSCVGCGALPVELLYFEIKGDAKSRVLTWATASELNCDYFEISRSMDGISYEDLGLVTGNGTTVEVSTYVFDDQNLASGVVYYRLQQFDYDGKSYDFVNSIKLELPHEGITLAPNPAENYVKLNFDESFADAEVKLTTLNGEVLDRYNLSIEPKWLDLRHIPKGIYVIDIKTESNRIYKRLLVN